MKSRKFIQKQNEITPLTPISMLDAQIVEAPDDSVGRSSQEQDQTTSASSDPVTEFKLWLGRATEKELEEAEPKLEEKVFSCKRSGRGWRLAMGGHIYRHREVVKKRKSRDWTKWVTNDLDMARSTAYDLMREWTQEYGHTIDEHNEPDQTNPKADEIKSAVVKAKEKRKGRRRAPATPESNVFVRVPWPEVFVRREQRDRFKEALERNEEGVRKVCSAAFYVIIGELDPESVPGADGGAVSVPVHLAGGEETTNDPISN